MIKTKFSSYCLNDIACGCKLCIKGRKLVLFISGICSRNCYYCSLSDVRKNKDKIWANERPCQSVGEVIEEIKASHAKGAGITGGDPLLFLERTIEYAKAMKHEFGKRFHIHIYLPTKLVDRDKLEKLSEFVDEVRFHPEFLCRELSEEEAEEDMKKIFLASEFWDKESIGIELPVFPDKRQEILNFILKVKEHIGFVNLNELEISETNINNLGKYEFKEGGYVVSGSIEAGIWILQELEKAETKIAVHLCTAELKDWHQYKNRLLLHEILPFGKRTEDGTVLYLAIYARDDEEFNKLIKQLKSKKVYIDNKKMRIILPEKMAEKLIKELSFNKRNKTRLFKIERVEEYPTYDGAEVMREKINA